MQLQSNTKLSCHSFPLTALWWITGTVALTWNNQLMKNIYTEISHSLIPGRKVNEKQVIA
jgi:hypothetical protein